MPSQKNRRPSIQQMYLVNALLNATLICILCFIVACYSFALEKSSILQESHLPHLNLMAYYESKHDNLWQIYLPILSDSEMIQSFSLFSEECTGELSMNTRKNLSEACNKMALTDSDIVGFILHSNKSGGVDYIYDRFSASLTPLSDTSSLFDCFPDSSSRFITGRHLVSFVKNPNRSVYGISGLFPDVDEHSGSLLVLYDASLLTPFYRAWQGQLRSEVLLISASSEIIYDSTSLHYGQLMDQNLFLANSGSTLTLDGTNYYIHTTTGARSRYIAVSLTPSSAVIRLAHKHTPLIVIVGITLNLISALFFLTASRLTTLRVRKLTQGIDRIGRQELDFRFTVYGNNDEFDQIALKINQMAEAMQRNIEQVYIYSLREKAAEMGELQAKFNPHFLYNTLEVIRSHLQQKGDNDTASMIVLMSRVFRSALNSSHFTTLRNECMFINSYLDIYRWRYQNSFEVIYDMDTTLLECGIIRNLLQPLIENYFVHGFSPDSLRNQLIISGQPDGSDFILLTVEDNGLGMSPERLHELNEQLIARDNLSEAGGYGLVNLNDRIRLFYGNGCGLSISSIPDHYTTISLRIRRMSLEEHNEWSKKLPEHRAHQN